MSIIPIQLTSTMGVKRLRVDHPSEHVQRMNYEQTNGVQVSVETHRDDVGGLTSIQLNARSLTRQDERLSSINNAEGKVTKSDDVVRTNASHIVPDILGVTASKAGLHTAVTASGEYNKSTMKRFEGVVARAASSYPEGLSVTVTVNLEKLTENIETIPEEIGVETIDIDRLKHRFEKLEALRPSLRRVSDISYDYRWENGLNITHVLERDARLEVPERYFEVTDVDYTDEGYESEDSIASDQEVEDFDISFKALNSSFEKDKQKIELLYVLSRVVASDDTSRISYVRSTDLARILPGVEKKHIDALEKGFGITKPSGKVNVKQLETLKATVSGDEFQGLLSEHVSLQELAELDQKIDHYLSQNEG